MQIFIATEPADMRKSIDGLSAIVRNKCGAVSSRGTSSFSSAVGAIGCPKCGSKDFRHLGDGKKTTIFEYISAQFERQVHVQETLA